MDNAVGAARERAPTRWTGAPERISARLGCWRLVRREEEVHCSRWSTVGARDPFSERSVPDSPSMPASPDEAMLILSECVWR